MTRAHPQRKHPRSTPPHAWQFKLRWATEKIGSSQKHPLAILGSTPPDKNPRSLPTTPTIFQLSVTVHGAGRAVSAKNGPDFSTHCCHPTHPPSLCRGPSAGQNLTKTHLATNSNSVSLSGGYCHWANWLDVNFLSDDRNIARKTNKTLPVGKIFSPNIHHLSGVKTIVTFMS